MTVLCTFVSTASSTGQAYSKSFNFLGVSLVGVKWRRGRKLIYVVQQEVELNALTITFSQLFCTSTKKKSFTERPQIWMILKEHAVKEIFTYNLFTIFKPGYPSYLKIWVATLIICSNLMKCIRYVYFQWFLLWIVLVSPPHTHLLLLSVYHFVRNNPQRSVFNADPGWTSSVVIKLLQKSDCWLPSSINLFADAFVLLFWLRAFMLNVPLTDCLNVRQMSIVRSGGVYTGFLCCAVCEPRAELHQNKTNTKRTVHRMYPSYFAKRNSLFSHCQGITFFFSCLL